MLRRKLKKTVAVMDSDLFDNLFKFAAIVAVAWAMIDFNNRLKALESKATDLPLEP